jgi:hypothetical protein
MVLWQVVPRNVAAFIDGMYKQVLHQTSSCRKEEKNAKRENESSGKRKDGKFRLALVPTERDNANIPTGMNECACSSRNGTRHEREESWNEEERGGGERREDVRRGNIILVASSSFQTPNSVFFFLTLRRSHSSAAGGRSHG